MSRLGEAGGLVSTKHRLGQVSLERLESWVPCDKLGRGRKEEPFSPWLALPTPSLPTPGPVLSSSNSHA